MSQAISTVIIQCELPPVGTSLCDIAHIPAANTPIALGAACANGIPKWTKQANKTKWDSVPSAVILELSPTSAAADAIVRLRIDGGSAASVVALSEAGFLVMGQEFAISDLIKNEARAQTAAQYAYLVADKEAWVIVHWLIREGQ